MDFRLRSASVLGVDDMELIEVLESDLTTASSRDDSDRDSFREIDDDDARSRSLLGTLLGTAGSFSSATRGVTGRRTRRMLAAVRAEPNIPFRG